MEFGEVSRVHCVTWKGEFESPSPMSEDELQNCKNNYLWNAKQNKMNKKTRQNVVTAIVPELSGTSRWALGAPWPASLDEWVSPGAGRDCQKLQGRVTEKDIPTPVPDPTCALCPHTLQRQYICHLHAVNKNNIIFLLYSEFSSIKRGKF